MESRECSSVFEATLCLSQRRYCLSIFTHCKTGMLPIPKPHDLSFCFHHRRIPQLKNHVLSYTESTDFRPISEARFRVSHGTLTAYSFLYLLRATFYLAKLFWSEPPKPSFQGFGRELSVRPSSRRGPNGKRWLDMCN